MCLQLQSTSAPSSSSSPSFGPFALVSPNLKPLSAVPGVVLVPLSASCRHQDWLVKRMQDSRAGTAAAYRFGLLGKARRLQDEINQQA